MVQQMHRKKAVKSIPERLLPSTDWLQFALGRKWTSQLHISSWCSNHHCKCSSARLTLYSSERLKSIRLYLQISYHDLESIILIFRWQMHNFHLCACSHTKKCWKIVLTGAWWMLTKLNVTFTLCPLLSFKVKINSTLFKHVFII